MKIETKELVSALNFMAEIVPQNKLKPITEIVQISLSDNSVEFRMSNHINAVSVRLDCENDINDVICINFVNFHKLVKLFTKETTTIKVNSDNIEVKCNGKYKLPIELDELGEKLTLGIDICPSGEPVSVNLDGYAVYYKKLAVGLPNESVLPLYRVYTEGEVCVSTDTKVMVVLKEPLFDTEINPSTLRVMSLLRGDVSLYKTDKQYIIDADNILVSVPKVEEECFPAKVAMPLVKMINSDKSVSVSKAEIKAMLKRFDTVSSTTFDVKPIYLFADNGNLVIKDALDNIEEVICETDITNYRIKLPVDKFLKLINCLEEEMSLLLCSNDFLVLSDKYAYFILGKVS